MKYVGNITKRMHWSVLFIVAILALGLTTYFLLTGLVLAGESHSAHANVSTSVAMEGPLSNATVSFGAWMTSPPVNRFPDLSAGIPNHHELIPQVAKIKAGGSVNFIISGFHQVIVYDDGTQPGNINSNSTVPPTVPVGVLLIDDPNNRIYRGLDPSLQPRDRVEVLHFANPGTYLVICGVRGHFLQGMFGFVVVLPSE